MYAQWSLCCTYVGSLQDRVVGSGEGHPARWQSSSGSPLLAIPVAASFGETLGDAS